MVGDSERFSGAYINFGGYIGIIDKNCGSLMKLEIPGVSRNYGGQHNFEKYKECVAILRHLRALDAR